MSEVFNQGLVGPFMFTKSSTINSDVFIVLSPAVYTQEPGMAPGRHKFGPHPYSTRSIPPNLPNQSTYQWTLRCS